MNGAYGDLWSPVKNTITTIHRFSVAKLLSEVGTGPTSVLCTSCTASHHVRQRVTIHYSSTTPLASS